MAHDWSAGRFFYSLRPGDLVQVSGRTYRVDSVRVMTVAQQFGVFNWRVPLVLMTCDGADRLVVSAS